MKTHPLIATMLIIIGIGLISASPFVLERFVVAQASAPFPLQQCVDVCRQRQLNGLTGRSGGCDDDNPAFGMRRVAIGIRVGREMVVARGVHV